VLPEIANKVSNVLDKPVPDITPVVTQIMNIVYLDSKVEYEKENGEGTTHAEIYVTNYTPKNKNMILLCRIPEAMVHGVSPQPMKIEGGFIHWNLKDLEPNRKVTISFDLLGLDKGDFEECELFYSKARGEIVGADQA